MRARIAEPDERSQWEWWAMRADPALELRNHGVYGERTDQIAARFAAAAAGADALVVQGGINDVVQSRPVEAAADDLARMVDQGLRLGLRVVLADVLPWSNGDVRASRDIARLNALIRGVAAGRSIPLLPFHDTLVDPAAPLRMRADWTDDGDHPSVEGHRLLGEQAFRLA